MGDYNFVVIVFRHFHEPLLISPLKMALPKARLLSGLTWAHHIETFAILGYRNRLRARF
jgi:hypothetical protein